MEIPIRLDMAKEKETRGRPSGFNDALSAKIIQLAKEGKTDAQIAQIIGVARRTFQYWKSSKPDFLLTLKEAKFAADELVEASLFRRATGYSHPAVKINQHEGRVLTTPYIEHYPPDTTAAIFWLKNRQPEKWRDKQEHELTGKDGQPLEPLTVNLILPDNGRSVKKGNE